MNNRRVIKKWLDEFAPLTSEDNDVRFSSAKDARRKVFRELKEFQEKAKINVKWRESLSNRLGIEESDIVKATNTIINMIEEELINAGVVRLNHFGDFKLINWAESKAVRFKPCETWLGEFNEPLMRAKIGLKRKITRRKTELRDWAVAGDNA